MLLYISDAGCLSDLRQEHTGPGLKENAIMLVRVRSAGPHIVVAVQVEPVSVVHS